MDGFNRSEDIQRFRKFLSEASLIDLPLIGRKLMWYKTDGITMSRLDRFLLTEEWLNVWPNLSQWGLKISVSDHCAVVLREKELIWGLKPFRMMKCWEDMEGYKEFVKKRKGISRLRGGKDFC